MAGIGYGDGLSPVELERTVALVERISRNVEAMTRAITGAATVASGAIDSAGKGLEDLGKDFERIQDETDEFFDRIERRGEMKFRVEFFNFAKEGKGVDKFLMKLDTGMKKSAIEFNRQLSEARGPLGTLGAVSGMTSALGGAKNAARSMMGDMPFGVGGLLGIMLQGAKKDEEFAARANDAAYAMQALGGIGKTQIGALNSQIRGMSVAWGQNSDDMKGTLSAFAQFSIGSAAFEKANVHAKGFMKNIAGTATAVDILNAAQPGHTAKLIGETMMNAGISVKAASKEVFDLSMALRAAGLNYSQFSAGIVQANSALRMHNQSLSGTAAIFMKVQGALMERGIGKERAGMMAMGRVQAAAGAISGMSEGLSGYVGQQLAARNAGGMGGMTDPFAIMTKMKLGAETGGEQDFMKEAFKELQTIAKTAAGEGGTKDEQRLRQIGALSKIGGMNVDAAAAIVDGANATDALMDPAKATQKGVKDLNTAFGTYSARQSSYERDMRIIQNSIAKIGSQMLSAVISTATMIIENIKVLPLRMKSAMPSIFGGGVSDFEQGKLDAADALTMQLSAVNDVAVGNIIDEIVTIGKTVGDAALTATSRGGAKAAMDKYERNLAANVGRHGSLEDRLQESKDNKTKAAAKEAAQMASGKAEAGDLRRMAQLQRESAKAAEAAASKIEKRGKRGGTRAAPSQPRGAGKKKAEGN